MTQKEFEAHKAAQIAALMERDARRQSLEKDNGR
jgi:hypothetical protein